MPKKFVNMNIPLILSDPLNGFYSEQGTENYKTNRSNLTFQQRQLKVRSEEF